MEQGTRPRVSDSRFTLHSSFWRLLLPVVPCHSFEFTDVSRHLTVTMEVSPMIWLGYRGSLAPKHSQVDGSGTPLAHPHTRMYADAVAIDAVSVETSGLNKSPATATTEGDPSGLTPSPAAGRVDSGPVPKRLRLDDPTTSVAAATVPAVAPVVQMETPL